MKSMETECIWPEVFTNKTYSYPKDDIIALACADGLIGWANCQIGNEPPEFFGVGMVKIGQILGISATSENLSAKANEILASRK